MHIDKSHSCRVFAFILLHTRDKATLDISHVWILLVLPNVIKH